MILTSRTITTTTTNDPSKAGAPPEEGGLMLAFRKPVQKAEHLQPQEESQEVKDLSVKDRRYLNNQTNKYKRL